MFPIRLFGLIAATVMTLAMISLAGPGSAATHGVFDREETSEIERIVRDHIRSNPEIILDALRELEQRQLQAEAAQSQRQIVLSRDALLNDPGSPVGGNPTGDVTIVEFFDYRCPYCKAVAPSLVQLLEEDRNIRFVYKEWPILGPVSVVGAKAALAAWKQGKYAQFHDLLMRASGQLSEDVIFGFAEEIGLDLGRLREDMESTEIADILRRNDELAAALGASGTPAFVIGDVLVPGAVDLAQLQALVEKARSDG